MTLHLADKDLNPPVLLAPMAGITDRPFRDLVMRFGAGMVVASTCVTGLFYKLGHGMLGTLVALAEQNGCDLPYLTLDEMQSAHAAITQEVFEVLGVENSVNSRISYGGTAPARVREQVARWKDIVS